MSPQVDALMREIAPVLERLVASHVEREVARVVRERDVSPRGQAARPAPVLSWRGVYVDGEAYGQDAFVVRGDRLFCARRATTQPPTPHASDWQLLANRAH